MKITGLILILLIIAAFCLWVWKTKRKKGTEPFKEDGAQIFNILVKGVYSPDVLRAKLGKKIWINL